MSKSTLPDESELIDRLADATNLSRGEISRRQSDKLEKYDGLVGRKAAVCLVALDQGVELFGDSHSSFVELNNLVPDLSDLNIRAKVGRILGTFEFGDKPSDRGRGIVLDDGTNRIKLMLWGEDVELADHFEENDTIELENAYTKTYKGDLQVQLRKRDGGLYLRGDNDQRYLVTPDGVQRDLSQDKM